MELTQLEYFRVVARLEHITKAAEALHVSQPALSSTIARLEKDVGTPLFDRSANRIHLNASGRIFLRYVDRIYAELEQGLHEVLSSNDTEFGRINFSVFSSGIGLEPVSEFLYLHPHISMHHYIQTGTQAQEQLEAGHLDFAVCLWPIRSALLAWQPLYDDHLVALLSKQHPLARKQNIRLEELANEPFALLDSDPELRILIPQLCRQGGFSPTILYTGYDIATISPLVSSGLCAFLCPSANFRYGLHTPQTTRFNDSIVAIPVTSPSCIFSIGIAKRKDKPLSRTAKAFYDLLLAYYMTDYACDSSTTGGIAVPAMRDQFKMDTVRGMLTPRPEKRENKSGT